MGKTITKRETLAAKDQIDRFIYFYFIFFFYKIFTQPRSPGAICMHMTNENACQLKQNFIRFIRNFIGRERGSMNLLICSGHITKMGWRSGAVVRASDFGPRGPWFEPRPVHISLWP